MSKRVEDVVAGDVVRWTTELGVFSGPVIGVSRGTLRLPDDLFLHKSRITHINGEEVVK